jgi:Staphylococcal nuclease homologue
MPATANGLISGAITRFSDDGWPLIAGHIIHLYGIDRIVQGTENKLLMWVNGNGAVLYCYPVIAESYRCYTNVESRSDRLDLAEALLENGAARLVSNVQLNDRFSEEALAAYRTAEQKARDKKRGVWKSEQVQ